MRNTSGLKKAGNPSTQFNKENASENGRKGGKASGESKRRKKTMQELAKMIANAPIESKANKKALEKLGVADEDLTNNAMVVQALYKECLMGNVKAIALWEQYTNQETDNLIDDIRELFSEVGGVI